MSYIKVISYKSPVGELFIGDFRGQLCLCDWKYRKNRIAIDDRIKKGLAAHFIREKTAITDNAILQLEEYFEGKRKSFDLPLLVVGTDFQKEIWKIILQIPYGETISYLHLSKQFGNKMAIRAVAAANGAHALSLFIPCHRVVGSQGQLTGYAGGLKVKEQLLKLENDLPHEQLKLF